MTSSMRSLKLGAKGFGIFASQKLCKGELVAKFDGKPPLPDETLDVFLRNSPLKSVRVINHSCNPNCILRCAGANAAGNMEWEAP